MDIWTEPDGGPSPEYYRELAETRGTAWPAPRAITRGNHAALAALAPADRGPLWRCPRCGGPATCPDLAATLPYTCRYGELDNGRWGHERMTA